MMPTKVEIGQFRVVDKGALKAFFSLIIYPQGEKILDCRYFVQGDNRWFSMPQKEIKYTDGRKSEYLPLISYNNKEYQEELKKQVLQALKDYKPQGKDEEKANANKGQARQVQRESQPVDLPF